MNGLKCQHFHVHPKNDGIVEHTVACFPNYTFGRMLCNNGMVIYTILECFHGTCEQLTWLAHRGIWEHEIK